jgi:hypothetical protein
MVEKSRPMRSGSGLSRAASRHLAATTAGLKPMTDDNGVLALAAQVVTNA